MKGINGGLLVVVGLALLWLAVTGRLNRLGEAVHILLTADNPWNLGDGKEKPPVSVPQKPGGFAPRGPAPLPALGNMMNSV